jgi:four helix bundle protein
MRRHLPHQRLIVYQKAASLYADCSTLTQNVRRRHWPLAEQLLRAVSSIALNIAEGATEFSTGDKARFYRMARRSAGEAAAALDLLERTGAIPSAEAEIVVQELDQVIAILIALGRNLTRSS